MQTSELPKHVMEAIQSGIETQWVEFKASAFVDLRKAQDDPAGYPVPIAANPHKTVMRFFQESVVSFLNSADGGYVVLGIWEPAANNNTDRELLAGRYARYARVGTGRAIYLGYDIECNDELKKDKDRFVRLIVERGIDPIRHNAQGLVTVHWYSPREGVQLVVLKVDSGVQDSTFFPSPGEDRGQEGDLIVRIANGKKRYRGPDIDRYLQQVRRKRSEGLTPTRAPSPPLDAPPIPRDGYVDQRDRVAGVMNALDQYRLVTLWGPGGIGKTSLAEQVSMAAASRRTFRYLPRISFGDSMSSVEDIESFLLTRILAECEMTPAESSEKRISQVKQVLADCDTLLILENCEFHQSAIGAVVEKLLRLWPRARVRVLATSQSPLGTEGEHVIPMEGLSIPHGGRWEEIRTSESYTLFSLRCDLFRNHVPSDDERKLLCGLLEKLAGNPLFIRIVSSHVPEVGLEKVVRELGEKPFGEFTGYRNWERPGTEHHASIYGCLDWSYRHLSEQEKQCFRTLGVFAGRFPAEAVERIGSIGNARTILRVLASRSLVTRFAQTDRFGMTLWGQQFAYSKLDAREIGEQRLRHMNYYWEWTDHLASGDSGALPSRDWNLDWPDFLSAALFAADRDRSAAQDIATMLGGELIRRGLWSECVELYRTTLDALNANVWSPSLHFARMRLAHAYSFSGSASKARALYVQESDHLDGNPRGSNISYRLRTLRALREVAKRMGEAQLVGELQGKINSLVRDGGNTSPSESIRRAEDILKSDNPAALEEAEDLLASAMVQLNESNKHLEAMACAMRLASVHTKQGAFAVARRTYEDARDYFVRLDPPNYNQLGYLYFGMSQLHMEWAAAQHDPATREGNLRIAKDHAERSLEAYRVAENVAAARTLMLCGDIELKLGKRKEAATMYEAVMRSEVAEASTRCVAADKAAKLYADAAERDHELACLELSVDLKARAGEVPNQGLAVSLDRLGCWYLAGPVAAPYQKVRDYFAESLRMSFEAGGVGVVTGFEKTAAFTLLHWASWERRHGQVSETKRLFADAEAIAKLGGPKTASLLPMIESLRSERKAGAYEFGETSKQVRRALDAPKRESRWEVVVQMCGEMIKSDDWLVAALARNELGDGYRKMGSSALGASEREQHWRDARNQFVESMAMFVNKGSPEGEAATHYELGRLYLEMDNVAEAIQELTQSIDLWTEPIGRAIYLNWLAKAHLRQGNLGEARECIASEWRLVVLGSASQKWKNLVLAGYLDALVRDVHRIAETIGRIEKYCDGLRQADGLADQWTRFVEDGKWGAIVESARELGELPFQSPHAGDTGDGAPSEPESQQRASTSGQAVVREGPSRNANRLGGGVLAALSLRQDAAGVKRETRTILLTDLVGYTAKMDADGESLRLVQLHNGHFQRVRRVLEAHGGSEIKTMGDAFLVNMHDTLHAVDIALALTRDSGIPDTQVRISIHVGLVYIFPDGDIFGLEVNFSSRMIGLVPGAGIIASEQVVRALKNALDPKHGGLIFTPLPDVEVRGISGKHTLYLISESTEPSKA